MTEAEKLRRQVKSMALLCALLGPCLGALTLLSYMSHRLLGHLLSSGLMAESQLDGYQRVSLDFGTRGAVVSIPLGAVLMVAGIRALRNLRRGREALVVAAAISIVGMFAYGAVWSVVVEKQGAGLVAHLGGWLVHLIQAGVVASALRFLMRADVRAACDEDPSRSLSDSHRLHQDEVLSRERR